MESTISDFAHLQIPLEEIVEATNKFADKNIIGKGGFGNVYRGKLMRSGKLIKISARRLDRKYGQGDVEFWTEVSMLSRLEHKNIVSMIGYCDTKEEKIIVYRFYPKGSLSMHLSDPTLRWSKRAIIAARVALAIDYLHYEEERPYYIIHRNINSSTILLDENWEPKLSGFEFSIEHSTERKNEVFLSEAIGTYGYIDPKIYETGGVTHRSDIYSFGVVLLELLCGRRANEGITLLAPLATSHHKNHTLPNIIHPDLRNQIHKESYEHFTELAFLCLDSELSKHWTAFNLGFRLGILCHKENDDGTSGLPMDEKDDTGEQSVSGMPTDEKAVADPKFLASGGTNDLIKVHSWPDRWHLINSMVLRIKNLKKITLPDLSYWCHGALMIIKCVRPSKDDSIKDFGEQSASGLPTDEKDDTGEHSASSVQEGISSLSMKKNNDTGEQSASGLSMGKKDDSREQSGLGLPTDYKDDPGEQSASSVQELTNLEDLRIPSKDLIVISGLERGRLSRLPGKNKHEPSKGHYSVKIVKSKGTSTISREFEILRRCRHPNIGSILGFCEKGQQTLLVYEYNEGTESLASNVKTSLASTNGRKCSTWEKCLKIFVDVARGLNYLQNEMGDQKMVIHRDIKCSNIMVDKDGRAKIIGFKNSLLLPTIVSETDKLKRESDVFSFGVLMFEIFYESPDQEKIVQLVRQWFKKGIIKEKLASKFKKENDENKKIITKGCNKDSLDTFLDILYKCLAKAQDQRAQIEVVLKELEKALSFQKNHKDPLLMSFEDIKSATQDFSPKNYIGEGGFGQVFKGKLAHKHGNGHYNIVAKKLDKSHGQGEKQFYNELQILYEYKHDNIIGLLGYSNETNEKFIVYEQASKGSLDRHLNDPSLLWRNRLEICIDVATGLDFIHGGAGGQDVVIHRDIKSANILLFDNWNAKVGDFGLSLISTINDEAKFTFDHACGTTDYLDPLYSKSGLLTVKSDVYSFGIVLLEILYGRAIYSIPIQDKEYLLNFTDHNPDKSKQDKFVFKAIRKEIMPKSLTTFLNIVQSCLAEDREKRPTSKEVLSQLKTTLDFQNEEA